jgi:hypothetical protein
MSDFTIEDAVKPSKQSIIEHRSGNSGADTGSANGNWKKIVNGLSKLCHQSVIIYFIGAWRGIT